MRTKIELPSGMLARHQKASAARTELAAKRPGDALAFFDDHKIVATDDGAELILYGEIGGFWGIDAWRVAKDLKSISADVLTVRIDSPGGSIFDAVLIYNALVDHPSTVTAVVDSMAASAASFLMQAADLRVVNRAAEVMIHQAWTVTAGTAEELREDADFLDRQNDKIVDIYAARSNVSAEVWSDVMAKGDKWYSAAEAVAVGLADEVVELKHPDKEEEDKNDDVSDASASARRDLTTNQVGEPAGEDAPDPVVSAAQAAERTAARQRTEQAVADAREAALAALG